MFWTNYGRSSYIITHKPTGIVVSCNQQISQHKNKANALQILRAKLWAKDNLDISRNRDIIRSYWLKDDHFEKEK